VGVLGVSKNESKKTPAASDDPDLADCQAAGGRRALKAHASAYRFDGDAGLQAQKNRDASCAFRASRHGSPAR
jgi:hypothetical protein